MLYIPLFISISEVLLIVVPVLLTVAFVTVAERKSMASMQRRLGPNIVGLYGLLQPFADAVKLLLKEYISPTQSNFILFFLGPIITLNFSLLGYSVVPFGPGLSILDFDLGILYLLAVSSLSTYGILLAGWSANSKYAFLGSLRSTAQLISYELILSSAILLVVLLSGSLNLTTNVESQRPIWYIMPLLPVFVIFLIGSIAETNRAPFDLAEAESELVSGFMTEHAAVIFVFFFLAEYASIVLICVLTSILFLGGYIFDLYNLKYIVSDVYMGIYYIFYTITYISNLDVKNIYDTLLYLSIINVSELTDLFILFLVKFNLQGLENYYSYINLDWETMDSFFKSEIFYFTTIKGCLYALSLSLKSCIMIFIFIWARASYPRIRYDQLMSLCWTELLPIIIGIIILYPCVLNVFCILPCSNILGLFNFKIKPKKKNKSYYIAPIIKTILIQKVLTFEFILRVIIACFTLVSLRLIIVHGLGFDYIKEMVISVSNSINKIFEYFSKDNISRFFGLLTFGTFMTLIEILVGLYSDFRDGFFKAKMGAPLNVKVKHSSKPFNLYIHSKDNESESKDDRSSNSDNSGDTSSDNLDSTSPVVDISGLKNLLDKKEYPWSISMSSVSDHDLYSDWRRTIYNEFSRVSTIEESKTILKRELESISEKTYHDVMFLFKCSNLLSSLEIGFNSTGSVENINEKVYKRLDLDKQLKFDQLVVRIKSCNPDELESELKLGVKRIFDDYGFNQKTLRHDHLKRSASPHSWDLVPQVNKAKRFYDSGSNLIKDPFSVSRLLRYINVSGDRDLINVNDFYNKMEKTYIDLELERAVDNCKNYYLRLGDGANTAHSKAIRYVNAIINDYKKDEGYNAYDRRRLFFIKMHEICMPRVTEHIEKETKDLDPEIQTAQRLHVLYWQRYSVIENKKSEDIVAKSVMEDPEFKKLLDKNPFGTSNTSSDSSSSSSSSDVPGPSNTSFAPGPGPSVTHLAGELLEKSRKRRRS